MKNTKTFKKIYSTLRPFVLSSFLLLCFSPFFAFAQFGGGSGTENDPYMITNAKQLAQLATYVNAGDTHYNDKHYKLNNDISLLDYRIGTGWTPIGNEYAFRGSFDGNDKIVSALYIHNPNLECTGLFGYTYGATLKNVVLENVSINGGSNVDLYTGNSAVGALVGYAYQCKITNCYASGEICGKESIGGIVGFFTGEINNCHSVCNITGIEENWLSVGGVVGKLYYNTHADRCYSTGIISVSGQTHNSVGGVIGEVVDHSVLVENCMP